MAGRSSSNVLDDLFGTSSGPGSGPGAGAGAASAPRARTAGASTLDDLFGSTPKTPAAAVTNPTPAGPQTATAAAADNFDAGRILRLEAELERLNRELEDTKRKRREDEEDLENIWKSKLDTQKKESTKAYEELKSVHKAQISKLQEEHSLEIERLKQSYERQFENITSSANQVGDIGEVFGKMSSLSSNIDKIAAELAESTSKMSSGQLASIETREERLKIRESRLEQDMETLKTEQLKVHELNLSLADLVKTQQVENDKEKWRVKEEWNRLKVEKKLFKETQEKIMESLRRERQIQMNEANVFRKSQNDLLFRTTTERELLEQEKNEFFAKRDNDIKRIKSEAYELDLKSQQIAAADQHVTEMKLVTEAKYRQLQHLESLLTAECAEIERMRNKQSIDRSTAFQLNLAEQNGRRNGEDEPLNYSQSSHRRAESVRASLKKHYEHLEKYAGQKVAAVAPQNN